ncbi:MAG: hypothetical protein HQK62_07990 [Desulfamplus sp.]|nr:hypothetical protein [Desulfamplus sp.]
MTEINDVSHNPDDASNDKVKDILNQYHQVSLKNFQKILSDKDAKHDESINILMSRLLLVQAELKESEDKLKRLDQVSENNEKNIAKIKDQYEKNLSDMKISFDVKLSEYRVQTEQLELELKEAQRAKENLQSDNEMLTKMLEESIELAEKFFNDKIQLEMRKKR